MAQNIRTFYACQAVAIQRLEYVNASTWNPVGSYEFVHGVQTVGLNTNFDIENIFELGQLEIYDSLLKVPSVEITLEKVLDNHPSIYGTLSNNDTLLNAGKDRANVKFAIYKDTENAGGAGGELLTIECTGMYVSNVSFTFPNDGACKESVTLTGNHKSLSGGAISIPAEVTGGTDEPSGGYVLTRKDVNATVPQGGDKLQSVTISVDLGREDIFELGTKGPKFKVPNYPVEVTAEIEYLADETNVNDGTNFDQDTAQLPVENQAISVTAGNYTVDIGSKCYLKSVQYGGGDATGGNATQKFSYSTYNEFNVTG